MTDLSTETIVVEQEGISLDLLIWRRFQTRTPGLVERTLVLNPGLADLGLVLPLGTAVVVPIPASENVSEQRPAVRLWD